MSKRDQTIVYGRTPMGQDLYDLTQKIKALPPKGRARAREIVNISNFADAFQRRWKRDPFEQIKWLCAEPEAKP